MQQQQALPFHFIVKIVFFSFLYFTIIKFLEVVSTYVVSLTELCLFVKCLYSLITMKVGKVVAKNDQAV